MLVEADLVLVMEKAHQQSLMDRYPAHSGKIMLLGHWSGQEIDDHTAKVMRHSDLFLNKSKRVVQSGLHELVASGLVCEHGVQNDFCVMIDNEI